MSIILKSYKEKSIYMSTAFIELQFCKISDASKTKKKVAKRDIKHCASDSLFIHHTDLDKFVDGYGVIFTGGIYANQITGSLDLFGVNYFSKDQINGFINRIIESKPVDFEIMIQWLNEALKFNGIYILGF